MLYCWNNEHKILTILDRLISSLCFNFFQSGKLFPEAASVRQGFAIGRQRLMWLQVCCIWAKDSKLSHLHQLRSFGDPLEVLVYLEVAAPLLVLIYPAGKKSQTSLPSFTKARLMMPTSTNEHTMAAWSFGSGSLEVQIHSML